MGKEKRLYKNHTSDDWATPKKIYKHYTQYYDPCKYKTNKDTLKEEWNYKDIYINPPYSKIEEFIEKAIETHKKYNNNIILLLPLWPTHKIYEKLFNYGIDIALIRERLHYNEWITPAPFETAFIKITGKENTINKYIKYYKGANINEKKNNNSISNNKYNIIINNN